MKKKIIPVLVAIVLILFAGASLVIPKIIKKYSPGTEREELSVYFDISGGEEARIMLQDELLEDRALVRDGRVYFTYSTVKNYLEDRFYLNTEEQTLKYTLPDVIRTVDLAVGTTGYTESVPDSAEVQSAELGYLPAFYEGDTLYIAADYVSLYCGMSYELFAEPNRVQLFSTEDTVTTAVMTKGTKVRKLGGIKSLILTEVSKDEQVIILETMDTWTKIKTRDCVIGYVENKYLGEGQETVRALATDYTEPVYPSITKDYKICMAWHQVMSADGNSTLDALMTNAKGVANTISPTWFMLNDNEGNFVNNATLDYVTKAHNMGMEVWALADDFTYDVDMLTILSSTAARQNLENNLVNTALQYGIDGINIDFEHISTDCGPHFAQFLRELSILTHKNGLVLSVDNYVPEGGSTQYHREEQGLVVDYVVIMGYDEHWSGCSEAGSVASIGYVKRGISDTIASGVPAEKIVNAVPFYTRVWATENATVTSSAVDMQTAADWISQYGITTQWDEETCQNYGEVTSGGKYYQVWLEDAASLQVKLTIMQNSQVAGVAAWKLGYETPDIWALISAYLNS